MVTLFWSFCVVLSVVLLARFRPAAIFAAFFVLFALMMRMVSLTYIDLAGPVFAEQLSEDIGGTGSSMPLFALSVLVFLFALAVVFRPSQFRNTLPPPVVVRANRGVIGGIVFYLFFVFVVLLYGDMFWRGVIPLFESMERFEYTNLYAGPFHHFLFNYSFLFAGMLGTLFVYPRLIGRGFSYRFVGLLFAVFGYFALTGHRFSAFFSFSSFFILPLSAVFVLKRMSALPSPPPNPSVFTRLLSSKSIWLLAMAGLVFLLLAVMFNSLVNVREYDDPQEHLIQRALIQPAELWWATWDRVIERDESTPLLALALMFVAPIDASRNTGIQYLMVKALGFGRTEELLSIGSQYAGGYPEVLFELVVPYAALSVALLFSFITAWLLRVIVVAVCRGNFGTVFMGIYVYFGFSLLYIGGMLNFLIAATFGLKVVVFILIFVLELRFYRKRRRLLRIT
jgi:hypothetical protein